MHVLNVGVSFIARRRRVAALAGAVMIICLLGAGCGSGSDSAERSGTTAESATNGGGPGGLDGGLDIAGKEVLFIHSSDSGNPFDVPSSAGPTQRRSSPA